MFNRKSSTKTIKFTGMLKNPEEKEAREHSFTVTFNVGYFAFDSQESLEKFVRASVIDVFQRCRENKDLNKRFELAKVLNKKGIGYQDGGAALVVDRGCRPL